LYRFTSFEKSTAHTLQKRYLRQDGTTRWVNLTADLLLEQTSGEPLAIVIVEDITERQEAEERIHHLALHDALTDLPNRTLLQDRLRQAMSEAQRAGALLALLFLDLDRFKIVNDSLGHAVGDQLLRAVAERLTHEVRGSDTVSRLGGDEFVIVLTAIQDASDVGRIASKLLRGVAEPLIVDGHTLNIATSIGISLYPVDGSDPATLLQHADTALYQAKSSGRNNYQFFAAEMNVRARGRLQLEYCLRRALERDEFMLHYQPQVDCVTGQVVAVEALLRWRDPELGWVAPDRFIPIAEEVGLIVPIGEWVLRKACSDSKAWRRAGLEHGRIALNISALQLQRTEFSERLAEILRETGLRTGDLELELTETLLIGEANAATLRQLKEMGVVLSIDDFGTGYSSLSYLRHFAIDKLKLDGSFLRDITSSADAATIVTALVTIAHCLRLAVVAEGVENRQQVEFLRERNCHLMQGYHFSRPLPAEDLTAWLRQQAESR
jgi:diguanylate cyclase (GGDEF)-like protein